MNFMRFHNYCRQNWDHHVLVIITGNAHKESCHKLLLILVKDKELYVTKTDCSRKMVLAFTIKKKLFNGKPTLQCGGAPFLFVFVVFSS